MCVSGRPIKAADALAAGLIDAVVEGDLEAGAVALRARRVAAGPAAPEDARARDRLALPGGATPRCSCAAGRELARKTRRHQTAPPRPIDAIEAAATLPFDEGCRRERELFLECAASDQAKALIHVFFAERGVAKVPGVRQGDAACRPSRTVAIVGAGTMGGGIAMACANAGLVGAPQRHDAGGARPRHGDHPQELRQSRSRAAASPPERVAERLARIHPQTTLRRLRARPT